MQERRTQGLTGLSLRTRRSVIPRFYQVHLGSTDFGDADSDTRVLPFATFCTELALP
jgi:hypothetical protein